MLPLSPLPPTPAGEEQSITTPATSPTSTRAFPESITSTELHQRLDPFTPRDPSCTLPCYNGLTPGEAGLNDVFNFYARLGIAPTDLIPGDYQAVQDGTGQVGAWLTKASDAKQTGQDSTEAPRIDVTVENYRATQVYVGWTRAPDYLTPARLLGEQGTPSAILLALVLDITPARYALHLRYSEANIGAAFYGSVVGNVGTRTICFTPANITTTIFGIFAPDAPQMEGLRYNEQLLPLPETLDIPTTDVITRLSEEECLSITGDQLAAWQALATPAP